MKRKVKKEVEEIHKLSGHVIDIANKNKLHPSDFVLVLASVIHSLITSVKEQDGAERATDIYKYLLSAFIEIDESILEDDKEIKNETLDWNRRHRWNN